MKKLIGTLTFTLLASYGQAQVPENFNDSLQKIIDSFQNEIGMPGISAAVLIKDMGIWQGVSGESHSGALIDTTMLLGIGSNTKLFTSVLCLKLAEQRIISLDDSLHQWLPKYKNIDHNITVRQLLQHQSGVCDYTETRSFPKYVLKSPDKIWTPEDILKKIGSSKFQAGTSVAYSNTNYILAGMILESATGIFYDILVRDSILIPLNLQRTFIEGFEPVQGTTAHPWGMGKDFHLTPRTAIGTISWSAGCIVSKPSDIVKWYNALFNQGFLAPEPLSELTGFISWPGESIKMGLGLFEIEYKSKTYWAHGGQSIGYSSFFVFDPINKQSVAVIMNDAFANSEPIGIALAKKIFELINSTSNGE